MSSATSDSGEVYVSVEDSGPGIDPAEIERLFGAFYTTKAEGLGMGLSICRSITEAQGGKLWLLGELNISLEGERKISSIMYVTHHTHRVFYSLALSQIAGHLRELSSCPGPSF